MARKEQSSLPIFVATILFFISSALYGKYYVPSAAIEAAVVLSSPAGNGIPLINPSVPPPINTTAVLLPDWEVLVIVSPETMLESRDGYSCLFETGEVSPASFSGVLQFPNRSTFSCILPVKSRGNLPDVRQPVLLKSLEENQKDQSPSLPPLIRWSNLMYDSLTTEDDVLLFVKGVKTKTPQGNNREFKCIFGDDGINGVRTDVISYKHEVFRCKRPDSMAVNISADHPVKVSLEIVAENHVVPSVAYYTQPRQLESREGRTQLCATNMVRRESKFLREWAFYHSKIGVEKFLLYDNGGDDDLGRVVADLKAEGFDVNTYLWRWPETQESAISHSAIYGKDACEWMTFLDVDEFLYSPAWDNSPEPSKSMLNPSIIPQNSPEIGEIIIRTHEFGPSGQRVHPRMGVTQGYTCRRKDEYKHKSIVMLDAIDDAVLNVIHHSHMKQGYKTQKMNPAEMVVNHYKYQAWPESTAKFQRRVSSFVLDQAKIPNPNSKEYRISVGYTPVEPGGWIHFFCDVSDEGLKNLMLKWFGIKSDSGIRMARQIR